MQISRWTLVAGLWSEWWQRNEFGFVTIVECLGDEVLESRVTGWFSGRQGPPLVYSFPRSLRLSGQASFQFSVRHLSRALACASASVFVPLFRIQFNICCSLFNIAFTEPARASSPLRHSLFDIRHSYWPFLLPQILLQKPHSIPPQL
jgi:hypothetical protein